MKLFCVIININFEKVFVHVTAQVRFLLRLFNFWGIRFLFLFHLGKLNLQSHWRQWFLSGNPLVTALSNLLSFLGTLHNSDLLWHFIKNFSFKTDIIAYHCNFDGSFKYLRVSQLSSISMCNLLFNLTLYFEYFSWKRTD